ncbi:MAG TPA: hypothetical protein VMV69_06750 [Pirellulales bacterium]|nr:hypothetical protein [Pirellulales bacterium]
MNFKPDDEVPRLLAQAMPGGAPPELRRVVLDAVANELTGVSHRSMTSWAAWGVAALVLLAIGLNVGVGMNEERRLARLRHHGTERAGVGELTETVAFLTDDASAERFHDYLASMLPRRTASLAAWPPEASPPAAWPPPAWPQDELRAIRGVSVDQ